MFQETLGGSRGPQALDELASEKCAPRFSGSATFVKTCARRRSESDMLPCRARCAPRPVPATNFAKPTTRKSTLRRNMSTLHRFLTGSPPLPVGVASDVRAGCAPRPFPGTHFASSTTRQAMLKGTTLIVHVFLQSGWEGPDRRPREMCAASHSWHAFRIVDDKTGHVERKNIDFVSVFYSQDGRARIDVSAGCAPRPIPGTHFISHRRRQDRPC